MRLMSGRMRYTLTYTEQLTRAPRIALRAATTTD